MAARWVGRVCGGMWASWCVPRVVRRHLTLRISTITASVWALDGAYRNFRVDPFTALDVNTSARPGTGRIMGSGAAGTASGGDGVNSTKMLNRTMYSPGAITSPNKLPRRAFSRSWRLRSADVRARSHPMVTVPGRAWGHWIHAVPQVREHSGREHGPNLTS